MPSNRKRISGASSAADSFPGFLFFAGDERAKALPFCFLRKGRGLMYKPLAIGWSSKKLMQIYRKALGKISV